MVVEQHVGLLRVHVDEVAPCAPCVGGVNLSAQQTDAAVERVQRLVNQPYLALTHGLGVENGCFLVSRFELSRQGDGLLGGEQTAVVDATFKILVCQDRRHRQTLLVVVGEQTVGAGGQGVVERLCVVV